TKYEAFDKLRHEHHLFLSLLTPMGVKAADRDLDLEQWQVIPVKTSPPIASTPASKATAPVQTSAAASLSQAPVSTPPSLAPPLPASKKTVGFTVLPDASATLAEPIAPATPAHPVTSDRTYFPVLSTLRLYAGWLLAWYGFFVALGYYSTVRALPFEIPLVMSFYASPLIYSVTLAVFLFLMCSAIHKAISGRTASGMMLTIGGIAAFVALKISV
ncbi:MAG: hypothetical protein PHZ00_07945, partial [Candidatus Peribacteraceae bacterium]|nr:hypothetical protein [Candidatus Peribacteraceae bacterium]